MLLLAHYARSSVTLANVAPLPHVTGMTTDPRIDPIKKRKLADDVQDKLLAFIAEEGLSPGDPLPSERDLMIRHQVGRTAIREAMQNLQRMGLVDIRHGERPRVAAPDMVGIVDQLGQGMRHILTHSAVTRAHLQDARTTFEAEMARIAADRCSPAQAKLLHILLDDHRQAQSDPSLFVKCDGAFHRAIAGISGNPIYELLSGSLFEWLSQFHVDMVRSPGLELLTLGEHEVIVDAITAGKADAAKEAMVQHLTRANLRYRNSGA